MQSIAPTLIREVRAEIWPTSLRATKQLTTELAYIKIHHRTAGGLYNRCAAHFLYVQDFEVPLQVSSSQTAIAFVMTSLPSHETLMKPWCNQLHESHARVMKQVWEIHGELVSGYGKFWKWICVWQYAQRFSSV